MKKEYLAPEFETVKIHGEDFLASSTDISEEPSNPGEPVTPPAEPEDEFDKDNFEGEIGDGNQGGIF